MADWHVYTAGEGPDVMLLHGLGASGFSWRHTWEPLSREFRVWVPDLPPHGRSPAPLDGDYRLGALVQGLVDFLDRRGIGKTILVGNSLGGGLALLMARDFPGRVAALVLLAPALAMTRMPWIFQPLRLPVAGVAAAALLGPWMIPVALRLAYHRRQLITPEVVAGYAAPFRELQRRLALRRLCRQLEIPPLEETAAWLPSLPQPVSLIWGEEDRILPVSQVRWIKDRLPQAELHLLPEVGHAPQEEAPGLVNQIIIDFLGRSLKN